MVNNTIPKGWKGCPENGNSLILGKFMALKTPLSNCYRNKMHHSEEYPPVEIFTRAERNKVKIGLWIDLTNTDRYYDKSEIKQQGCEYVKLSCSGHGTCPSISDTRRFISLVHNFILERPQECIAVHCTHGFNRTGFLIVAFLVEKCNFNVRHAVEAFATSRPPGIYRGNYITELFRRYGNSSEAPPPPPRPKWAHK